MEIPDMLSAGGMLRAEAAESAGLAARVIAVAVFGNGVVYTDDEGGWVRLSTARFADEVFQDGVREVVTG
jgi:hypothetical protein